jgi:hypothetical protein
MLILTNAHCCSIIFIQAFVIEFLDRPGSPLFGCERFIPGKYIKHNSNASFVDHTENRMTPQTFTHFTHFASKGKCMVVDMQGVNDLYTDPQLHTHNYHGGEGDLGPLGMALFFATYSYNSLSKSLRLPEFDLAPEERRRLQEEHTTQVRWRWRCWRRGRRRRRGKQSVNGVNGPSVVDVPRLHLLRLLTSRLFLSGWYCCGDKHSAARISGLWRTSHRQRARHRRQHRQPFTQAGESKEPHKDPYASRHRGG